MGRARCMLWLGRAWLLGHAALRWADLPRAPVGRPLLCVWAAMQLGQFVDVGFSICRTVFNLAYKVNR